MDQSTAQIYDQEKQKVRSFISLTTEQSKTKLLSISDEYRCMHENA